MVDANSSANNAVISIQSLTEDGFHQDEVNINDTAVEPPVEAPTQRDANNASSNRSADPMDTEPPEMTITSHPLESIDDFRKLMFNDAITTVGDKERWIYECIATSSDLTNINERQNGNGNHNR